MSADLWTPWTVESWGDGTANVEDADGDVVVFDIREKKADRLVAAVNAYAPQQALITELTAALADAPCVCPLCGGDGKETCDNPDHGFITAVGGDIGRIGCPCCGHDERHKVRNGGTCEVCDGAGSVTLSKSIEYCGNEFDERVEYFEEANRATWLVAARAALSKAKAPATGETK